MGFNLSLDDSNKMFSPALNEAGEEICDGKYVGGSDIFCLIADHSSKFIEFGDGDKRVRPNTPEEFEALRNAVTESTLPNKELTFEIIDALEANPSYYLTPSY